MLIQQQLVKLHFKDSPAGATIVKKRMHTGSQVAYDALQGPKVGLGEDTVKEG